MSLCRPRHLLLSLFRSAANFHSPIISRAKESVMLKISVYCCSYVCIAVLTLDAGLLARSQYPEVPVSGHLDTGFSWFPCVYKRMLSWFPSFQVAITCFSCNPPD